MNAVQIVFCEGDLQMPKRIKMTRNELKIAILAAARELIKEGGLPKLTAREIAKRVGCALGTTYNIFENLDALIVELNGETLDDLFAALDDIDLPPGEERLLAYASCYVEFTAAHRTRWETLFEHRMSPGHQLPDWYFEKLGRPFALVEEALAPFFQPGEEHAQSQSARVLWAGLHGLCSLGLSDKLSLVADVSLKDLASRHIRLHVMGLTAASQSAVQNQSMQAL